MEIFAAIAAFFIFFLFMATGLILKGQPLKGSCGGVAKLMGNEDCEWCGGDPNKCDDINADKKVNVSSGDGLAYDVMSAEKVKK